MTSVDPEARRQKIKIGVAAVIFLSAGGVAWYTLGGESAESLASERAFMCAECNHVFEYTLQMGDKPPVKCKKCGKMAAYQAETCYWTKDASGEWKAKKKPTYVLWKKRVNPETEEKTFCPDCGREVVGHNPPPPEELMEAAEKAGK